MTIPVSARVAGNTPVVFGGWETLWGHLRFTVTSSLHKANVTIVGSLEVLKVVYLLTKFDNKKLIMFFLQFLIVSF